MKDGQAHRALLRALAAQYPGLLVLHSSVEGWASATFIGARHVMTCTAGVDLAELSEIEFALPGHIVADILASPRNDRVIIEALTVEDG